MFYDFCFFLTILHHTICVSYICVFFSFSIFFSDCAAIFIICTFHSHKHTYIQKKSNYYIHTLLQFKTYSCLFARSIFKRQTTSTKQTQKKHLMKIAKYTINNYAIIINLHVWKKFILRIVFFKNKAEICNF